MEKLKFKKILCLWLFLSMGTFLSCGDIGDPIAIDTKDVLGVNNIQFLKGRYWINEGGSGLPCLEMEYVIDEGIIGGDVIIRCAVQLPDWPSYDRKIIAKVISSKTGDVKYIALTQQGNVFYIQPVPPPPLLFIGRICLSDVGGEGDLKVSPNGDMLIVEINSKDTTDKKTLPIKAGR